MFNAGGGGNLGTVQSCNFTRGASSCDDAYFHLFFLFGLYHNPIYLMSEADVYFREQIRLIFSPKTDNRV